jgi:transcription-repair coupling factor (superfamily II helicase)
MSPGEYSIRGGLIDLFPMGSALPYRLDLFDDSIESIKTFDADTQRSLFPVPEIRLLPGREFPMDDNARAYFRSRWRECLKAILHAAPFTKIWATALPPPVLNIICHCFLKKLRRCLIMCQSTYFALSGSVDEAMQRFWSDTRSRYQFLKSDRERPVLAPEQVFLRDEDFYTLLKPFARWVLPAADAATPANDVSAPVPDVGVNRRADDPLVNLRSFLLKKVSAC